MTLLGAVIAACAGGVGALARWACTAFVSQRRRAWAVLLVNIAGSAIAGLAASLLEHGRADPLWSAGIIVGFCGGFTTFSTFALDAADGIRQRRWMRTALLTTGSVLLTLVACSLGLWSGSLLTGSVH